MDEQPASRGKPLIPLAMNPLAKYLERLKNRKKRFKVNTIGRQYTIFKPAALHEFHSAAAIRQGFKRRCCFEKGVYG